MEHIRKDKIFNIPNCLTAVRIALLPVVVWRYVIGDKTGALIAYLAAMLTDAVDGFIARKFDQVTALGKLLDPLADKLSLITLMTLFVVPVMYDLFYRKPPVNIDVGDDGMDDLPDDAAEFAAEFAARRAGTPQPTDAAPAEPESFETTLLPPKEDAE